MHRYWIIFEKAPFGPPGLGCGVTANDLDDAIILVKAEYPRCVDRLDVRSVTVDVDVSTLDGGHVLPNIGNLFRRGVWWPRVESAY
jgi:hypothetical protein